MSLCDDLSSLFADSIQNQQRVIVDHIRKKVADGAEFVVFDSELFGLLGIVYYRDLAKLQEFLEDNGICAYITNYRHAMSVSSSILIAYGWPTIEISDIMKRI